MKKVVDKIKKMSFARLLIYIGIALVLIGGSSYAYLNFNIEGNETNLVQAGCFEVSFKESNIIDLSNQVPISDEEGKLLTPYTFTIENTCEIEAFYEVTINTLVTSNLENENKTKVYLSGDATNGPIITNQLKNVSLSEKPSDVANSYLLTDGYLKAGNSKTFNLNMWIDYYATSFDGSFDSKIIVTAIAKEYVEIVDDEDEPIIKRDPNTPELASNMIPVTYNGTSWVKADSGNSNKSWYDYDNKKWANAVTVTSANRSTYLSASAGTPISMDDINTMWVWIPRFSAKRGGQLCSTIEEPSLMMNPTCYINDQELEKMSLTMLLLMAMSEGGMENITPEMMESEEIKLMQQYFQNMLKFMVENPEYLEQILDGSSGELPEELLEFIEIYIMLKAMWFLSDLITLSEEDLDTIYGLFEVSEEVSDEVLEDMETGRIMIDMFLEYDLEFLVIMLLTQEFNVSIIPEINFDVDELLPFCEVMSDSSEEVYNQCVDDLTYLSQADNETKLQFMLNESMEMVPYAYSQNPELMYKFDGKSYNVTKVNGAGIFDVSFVDTRTAAHEAFTFGEEELDGIWVAKFEASHQTLSESNEENSLACINETCENAKGIEILPNRVSLRNQTIDNFFYASRSMEQSGNNYGLAANEVDTHMMKNSEWGAVAYLTQSIYGRCSSLTNCTEVGINNNNNYITGYGAPAGSDYEENDDEFIYVIPQAYNTTQGMDASTTGNIYGVYDMSGGAFEYVMGIFYDVPLLVNFDQKYYNSYDIDDIDYIISGGQHALMETSDWYGDFYIYVSSDNPFFRRGGRFDFGSLAGLFTALPHNNSGVGEAFTFRPILVK